MARNVTSRNTKAEILEGFAELKKEKLALESKIKKLNQELSEAAKASLKIPRNQPKVETKQESKPPNTTQVAQANIDQIIRNLEQLQIGFGSSVSNLSEQLIAEASQLEELQNAVAESTEQLQELHDLEEIEEETLEELIRDYKESAKAFEEELSAQREALGQQIQELKTAWQKEQENHQRDVAERNETHQKTQQRDEEEYQYNLELERSLDEEEYEQRKQALYQELEEERQAQEKQWEEREKTIAEREKQYAEAKQKVEEFKQKLESKIKQGKEEGRGIGRYQGKVKADLRGKEIEGQKFNYQLRIESLEETIQNQIAQIQSLSKKLDAASRQNQDLALKAIEGKSNQESFEAMKAIALEQAKNPQKGK